MTIFHKAFSHLSLYFYFMLFLLAWECVLLILILDFPHFIVFLNYIALVTIIIHPLIPLFFLNWAALGSDSLSDCAHSMHWCMPACPCRSLYGKDIYWQQISWLWKNLGDWCQYLLIFTSVWRAILTMINSWCLYLLSYRHKNLMSMTIY